MTLNDLEFQKVLVFFPIGGCGLDFKSELRQNG